MSTPASAFARALALASLVSAAGCGTVLKPPAPDAQLRLATKGSLFEGGNGYRFALLPDAATKIIRVDVRYPVGSAHDPVGKAGLAHLVEHLLFEVEIERAGVKTSIGAELSRLAPYSNALTYADFTHYEVMAPPAALDELMALEADRLAVGCAGLTPAIFARTREVVLNELRERQGAGGADLSRVVHQALYPDGHPYRATDSVATVGKLELADVCGFLADQYQRGKAIVVVSGAVDADAVGKAAGRHFGRLPPRNLAEAAAPSPVEPAPGLVRLRADVDEPELIITWPLPPMAAREYRLLELGWATIATRLGAFASTYGWGHFAQAFVLGGHHAPILAVSVTLNSLADLDEARDAAGKAAEFALREDVWGEDKDDRTWVQRWHEGVESLISEWESLGGRAWMFADFLQFEQGEGFLVARVDALVKASPTDARAIARRFLAPARARMLVIEPGEAGGNTRLTSFRGGDEAHGVEVDPAMADQPLPLPDGSLALETVRYQADNGLSVILWPHGEMPLAQAQLVIDSGSAHEPSGQEGLALLEGAGWVGEDSMIFGYRELATEVDQLIEGATWELREPGHELKDAETKVLRGQLRLARAAERRSYEIDMLAAVYGKAHPYARPPMTEASLDAIDVDSVFEWARDHVVPANVTLVMAGKFDPGLVKQHIAYRADQVARGDDSPDQRASPTPSRAFIAGIAKKSSPTVTLQVRFAGDRGLDRSYARALVLEAVLGNKLASLRSKQALTYGFSASFTPRRAGGMWVIGGEADASRAADAGRAMVTALAEMRRDPESYRLEFVLARQQVLAGLLSSAHDSGAVIGRLADMARFDLADDFYDDVATTVSGLVLKDFHRYVAVTLDAEGQVAGAFGNEEAVGEALGAMRGIE